MDDLELDQEEKDPGGHEGLTDAVGKLYPGAKVLEAETKKGPQMDEITLEVQVGEGEHYVRIKPDGTLVQRLVRIPAVVEIPIE